ncbi:6355_t:CDS:1, partial [Cetraspora pellucida]
MSLDLTFNEVPDPQYLITFKHNIHDELIINHEFVETIDNTNEKKQDYIEELSVNREIGMRE